MYSFFLVETQKRNKTKLDDVQKYPLLCHNPPPPQAQNPLVLLPILLYFYQLRLFCQVNSHFYDFGIRDTPKSLKIFLGVPTKILKKVKVFPGAAKGLFMPAASATAGRSRKQNPFAAPGKKPYFFQNFGQGP